VRGHLNAAWQWRSWSRPFACTYDSSANGVAFCHPGRAGASAEATRDHREAICLIRYHEELLGLCHVWTDEDLVVGVTNDVERRTYEHENKSVPGFTSKYRLDRLVYFEEHAHIRDAIARKTNQIVAARKKDGPYRIAQSEMERLEPGLATRRSLAACRQNRCALIPPLRRKKCGSGRDDNRIAF
jgi:predicted GIY-YIG superfamily endonuclease